MGNIGIVSGLFLIALAIVLFCFSIWLLFLACQTGHNNVATTTASNNNPITQRQQQFIQSRKTTNDITESQLNRQQQKQQGYMIYPGRWNLTNENTMGTGISLEPGQFYN